jgi:outer membrane receptor protein involved in Fe transport
MKKASFVRAALLASAGVAAFTGGSAYAQDTGATTGLGEILVTARKQTESLINVPVAVSAIGGEEIERKGVTDLTRIAQLAPQVMLAQADSGTGASFSIRGLGTSFLDPGLDQSVVVVLDGMPISRGQVVLMGMFDLAQVEVLKGPQALFFGKNSPAGVVNLTSAGATDTLEGYVRAGYEFKAREKYVEAAISGPLSETLKGRIAVRGSDMRGWMKNMAQALPSPLPPEFATFFPVSAGAGHKYGPGNRDLMGRTTLTWEPSPAFDATWKVAYGDHKDNATTTQQYCDPSSHDGPVSIGGFEDTSVDCKFDNKILSSGVPKEFIQDTWQGARSDGRPFGKVKTLLTNLAMNYKTDDLTFTSVSSYLDLKFAQMNNYDQTSYGLANSAIGEHTKVFSQELRLTSDFDAPVNFTLGGYYEDMKRGTYTDTIIFFVGPVPAGAPGEGRFDNFNSQNKATGKTVSAFGQVRWDIMENLELAGGVRYTKEKRTQNVENLFIHPYVGGSVGPNGEVVAGPLGTLVPVGLKLTGGKFQDTNWSPEATLTYKPTPDTMVYAAYKTGYKSGGFPSLSLFKLNPDGTVPQGGQFGFGPEKAKGFEAGFKAKLANNTIRFEATVYSYKYSDLQQSIFDPPTFSFLIKNAAAARIKGIELQGEWLATEGLRLNGSAAYNDAKYLSFPNNGCYTGQTVPQGCAPNSDGVPVQNLKGRRLPRAPKWNLMAGFNYDTPISNGWMVGLSGDVNYTSGYATQETQPPFAYQKSFALWNAGVRFFSEDKHYELAFIGRNLANKYYVQLSTATTFGLTQDQIHAATPRPRELRVQGTYRF